MTFRVGQKVVCVNEKVEPDEPGPYVKQGAIYTIAWIGRAYGHTLLDFYELQSPAQDGWCRGQDARAFRPVVERKTDISIFKEMLNKTSVDA